MWCKQIKIKVNITFASTRWYCWELDPVPSVDDESTLMRSLKVTCSRLHPALCSLQLTSRCKENPGLTFIIVNIKVVWCGEDGNKGGEAGGLTLPVHPVPVWRRERFHLLFHWPIKESPTHFLFKNNYNNTICCLTAILLVFFFHPYTVGIILAVGTEVHL